MYNIPPLPPTDARPPICHVSSATLRRHRSELMMIQARLVGRSAEKERVILKRRKDQTLTIPFVTPALKEAPFQPPDFILWAMYTYYLDTQTLYMHNFTIYHENKFKIWWKTDMCWSNLIVVIKRGVIITANYNLRAIDNVIIQVLSCRTVNWAVVVAVVAVAGGTSWT